MQTLPNTIPIHPNYTAVAIPFAPGYYVDLRGERVFHHSRLCTYQVYSEHLFINDQNEVQSAVIDLGMLHEDDTRYQDNPDYNSETSDYGFDLHLGRIVSWQEIVQSVRG